MGLSSNTQKTKSQETAVTQPNIPGYATPAVQGYFNNVANTPVTPGMFQTPANDVQVQAGQGAANLGGWQSGMGASNDLATRAANTTFDPVSATRMDAAQVGPVQSASAAQLFDVPLDRYLNPTTNALVNTTLAGFDDNAGRVRAAQEGQLARSGAFGGSRAGIAQAQTEADLARTRAQTEAGLRSAAYDRATGLAQFDTGNRQQANLFNADAANNFALTQAGFNQSANQFNAGAENDMTRFNATLAEQEAANQLAAAGLLGSNAANSGSLAQGDVNAQLAAGGSLFDVQRQNDLAPVTALAAQEGLIDPALLAAISGQTINTTGTSTTKSNNGLLGQLIGAGAQLGGAALMSERRVKRDIEQVGALPDGLGVYRYNYLWDEPGMEPRVGVMVDEVAELRPWALGPLVDGIQTVDYGRL